MATVQVGGHITLLFSIHDDALLPRNQGSRGAGLSLAKGVRVSIKETGRSEVIEEGQEMAGWDQDIPPIRSKGVTEVKIHSLDSNESLSCLLYTSPSPRDKRQSRMPSSA